VAHLTVGEPDVPTLTLGEHPHSTSTLTHLLAGDGDAQRPLATESRRAEGLRRGTAAAGSGNATLPRLGWLCGADDEVEGFKAELWTRFCGRQCGGERARARRGGGGNGGTSSPFWSRLMEGNEMEELGASWRPLNASWADMWGRGRCTVATARPRINDGLRPVGHD
jgi:hypothetical protein